MLQADFNHNHFEQGNNEGDNALLVKFEVRPKEDKTASREQGRPIFKDVEYVDIRTPGSRNGHICRPATLADKQRFSRQYDAFKRRVEAPVEGTPLAEWTVITRSRVEELQYFNLKTVEQLANMRDSDAGRIMGGLGLKQQAKEWLEQNDAEAVKRVVSENAELKAEVAELKEQVAAMLAASKPVAKPEVEELEEDDFEEDDIDEPEEVKPTKSRRRKK